MDDHPTSRTPKPFARWSADTEQAFLLALKLTGQATKACAEIGRGKTAAYKRRDRDPEFARAWDAAVATGQAEWAALATERQGGCDDGAGGGRLVRGRGRVDGWDTQRRGAFLRVLARTKDVRAACRAADMSSTSAYALRERSPPFAKAWAKMLAAGAPSVLDAAMERAVHGWVEPIVAGGKVIGERRRYSDSLLRALLLREGAAAKGMERQAGRAVEAKLPRSKEALEDRAIEAARQAGGHFLFRKATEEETNASLGKHLDGLAWRLRRDMAEAQEREWTRWREYWGTLGARPRPLAGPGGVLLLPAPD